jgi:hypothetical protein
MTPATATKTVSRAKTGAGFAAPTWAETDAHARLSPSSLAFSRKLAVALPDVELPKLRGLIRPSTTR